MYPYFGNDKGEQAKPEEYQAQYENYYLNDEMAEEALDGYGETDNTDAFVFGEHQYRPDYQPGLEARAEFSAQRRPGGMPGRRPEHRPEHQPEHRPRRRPEYRPEHRPGPRPEHRPMPRPDHRPMPHPGRPQPPRGERPQGPPPRTIPRKASGTGIYAVDPGAIRHCMYEYIYIWLRNGQSFWMYLTYIGPKSISGYRWMDYGWVYAGFDLDYIESFYCMPY